MGKKKRREGFTLLELIIVIAILAIVSIVTVAVLNPIELLKRTRDTRRLTDLQTLHRAVAYYEANTPSPSLGDPTKIYLSLPDTDNAAPAECDEYSLPSPPPGFSYVCALSSSFRNVDGSGWIPITFTSLQGGSPLSTLPIDPLNTPSSYYTYVAGGSWALTAILESEKYLKERAAQDGGYNPGKFELGTNLGLVAKSEGLVGWWTFDEGSGTTARDSSGNNNHGTLMNGPTWTQGKVGAALSFDGVDDRVDTGDFSFLTGAFTVSAWVYATQAPSTEGRTVVSIYRYNGGGCNVRGWNFGAVWTGNTFRLDAHQGTGSCAAYASDTSYFANELNKWHLMVGVFSPNQFIKLYKDAVPIENNATTLSSVDYYPGDILRIGRRSAENQSHFAGLIDDVRIYNRALSDAEIQAIYNATR